MNEQKRELILQIRAEFVCVVDGAALLYVEYVASERLLRSSLLEVRPHITEGPAQN